VRQVDYLPELLLGVTKCFPDYHKMYAMLSLGFWHSYELQNI